MKFTISSLLIVLTLTLSAQDTSERKDIFPSGIFADYGQGLFSVKDEYISNEKYSGIMPYYNLEWVRFPLQNGYRLQFEYRKSTEISNNNISAEAQQFNFNQDFIIPVGNFSLFSKDVFVYSGPSVQLFYYEIFYHFVTPGTFITPSAYGYIGSLGINGELIYRINDHIYVETLLRSNLLSFTNKKVDIRNTSNDSNPALLTIPNALKFDAGISLRYYIFDRFSISFGYNFDLSMIGKWDNYIAVNNNLNVSLNFRI